HLAQHLGAHIFELVLKLDFLGDGNAVLGDARCAIAFVDDDVAALRPQSHLDGVGEDVDALQNPLARIAREFHVLGCHLATLSSKVESSQSSRPPRARRSAPGQPTIPRMSLSFIMIRSSPPIFTSVPDHLPNRMRSPALTSSGVTLPSSLRAPVPTATTSPSCGFSLAVSGMMIPPEVFSSASTRRTRTRSCRGRKFMRPSPGTSFCDDLAPGVPQYRPSGPTR